MRLTRCFVPPPLVAGDTRLLPDAAATHVARVLRARAGQLLTLFDGRGGEYDATILAIDRHGVRVHLDLHRAVERESALRVTLLQALARGERMDLIVQKATELGVASIVAWGGERSVVRLDDAGLARRCEHWRAIAISACQQCGRNRVPAIDAAADLAGACARADTAAVRLLLAPDAQHALTSVVEQSALQAAGVTLAVGPEGGFSDAELALASHQGFQSCRLGPRVLRAETAPLAALAALQAVAGDFRHG
jgi:16S rRNA (uracil1498-N3)-methyltransferase